MKKNMFVIMIILIASGLIAGIKVLTWDSPTNNVDGSRIVNSNLIYYIYAGNSVDNYSVNIAITNSIINLPYYTTNYIAMTASYSNGVESPLSQAILLTNKAKNSVIVNY